MPIIFLNGLNELTTIISELFFVSVVNIYFYPQLIGATSDKGENHVE